MEQDIIREIGIASRVADQNSNTPFCLAAARRTSNFLLRSLRFSHAHRRNEV
jgi:hypothetical protein